MGSDGVIWGQMGSNVIVSYLISSMCSHVTLEKPLTGESFVANGANTRESLDRTPVESALESCDDELPRRAIFGVENEFGLKTIIISGTFFQQVNPKVKYFVQSG